MSVVELDLVLGEDGRGWRGGRGPRLLGSRVCVSGLCSRDKERHGDRQVRGSEKWEGVTKSARERDDVILHRHRQLL